jgi:hypothetical protein
VPPEFVECQTSGELATTNLVPSADEATETPCTLFDTQSLPELVEVKTALSPEPPGPRRATTTNFLPSADEATELQLLLDKLFEIQETPELVEV